MNLCKDCKYFGYKYYLCNKVEVTLDPVLGGETALSFHTRQCMVERGTGSCGPKGKNFVAIEVFPSKISGISKEVPWWKKLF